MNLTLIILKYYNYKNYSYTHTHTHSLFFLEGGKALLVEESPEGGQHRGPHHVNLLDEARVQV